METFGNPHNRRARLYTLENDWMKATVTDFGGALVALEVANRTSRKEHVVLGFDDAAAYATTGGSFGALLGRNANRISGGQIDIDGRTYRLEMNEPHATLHGGPRGFGKQFWSASLVETQRLVLSLTSPNGDQGFPGEVSVSATYALEDHALRLCFDAKTSQPTPLTLSAHPYFNLDGVDAMDCLGHRVTIFASHFLPTDQWQIPTGEISKVAGTPFDFRKAHAIGERIRHDHQQLRYGHGYDHYFIFAEGDRIGVPQLGARVEAETSGLVLEVLTTHRGLQFYSGNNLNGSVYGRGGSYRQSAGFAFEPQGFPDAPNRPNFPSTILRTDEPYHEEIIYRFSILGEDS